MKQFSIALLISMLSSFGLLGQDKTGPLNLPDTIITTKQDAPLNFTGTHVYISVPKQYGYDASRATFFKDADTFIKVVESPSVSYKTQKTSFLRVVEEQKEAGFYVHQVKELLLNNLKVIAMDGLDKETDQQHLILLIGNESNSYMVYSEFPASNSVKRREVLNSVLSIYIDEDTEVNLLSLQEFGIDLSSSQFKINSFQNGMFLYTINGIGNPNDGETNFFLVQKLNPVENDSIRLEYGRQLINNYVSAGLVVISTSETKYATNGFSGWQSVVEANQGPAHLTVYQIVMGDNDCTIVFAGSAYDGRDAMLKQFESIGKTIKKK